MTAIAKTKVASEPIGMTSLRAQFLETADLVQRVYHQMLDVIKDELDRRDEHMINSTQAMLLFKIGDRELTAAQLCAQGLYLGANVSHNLKKLAAAGYVGQEPSQADHRSTLVRLTEKGERVSKMLDALFSHHLSSLEAVINVGERELGATNATLDRLECWLAQPKHHANGQLLRRTRWSRRPGCPGVTLSIASASKADPVIIGRHLAGEAWPPSS
jgi:DNA-binding MarR family transcriptional regulator